MTSEGMPPGAVQAPPTGEPIILGPDHPTTGGYPVIACIATVDLPRIGQLRPGDTLRFERITQAGALGALRERERMLDAILPPVHNG
jgi:allophanate hydrolase subunit 2